ncbi:MAG: aspartate--tRNA ligase [Defluviitaleaceae bacterium]|nr:aspartate--tRNA ligase [Defluviitaleaceae bacterium]
MSESMKGMKRTHYAGVITLAELGQTVTVMGWVNKRRYLNNLIFIVVRDRTGIVQVVVDEKRVSAEMYSQAKAVRGEYVVAISGKVIARTPENINPDMPTGEIEIDVEELRVLSESEVPPFQVADEDVGLDLRLKHRYIDLRRPEVQHIMKIRHETAQSVRRYLSADGFLEIETPYLTNTSPEGARDYLVPSRIHQGQFYALPQSPQQLKQLLMISGMDKYFQLARCFRDEDLRADRQPEFTQIDIEMSFVDTEEIYAMVEGMMTTVFKDVKGIELKTPFLRITWNESMERFGTDKPDLRFGMELKDISSKVADCEFQVFTDALAAGGSVRGINAEGCAGMPRKQLDALVETARQNSAKGLAWIILAEDGTVKSTVSKFFSSEQISEIAAEFGGKPGDLILLCADKNPIVLNALGAVRLAAAKWKGLTNNHEDYRFLWVTDFPLLQWSEEDQRFYAEHHPFTAPFEEDEALLETNPGALRGQIYDLVLNGFELGSGSIRIHRSDLQSRLFAMLGFTPEAAQENFGHFLEALKYGVPPHGGIALGLDRIVMLMTGADSLREVIAFPKVKDASCPMTHAPSPAADAQLDELGIKIRF